MNSNNNIDSLIAKVLSHEATPDEWKELEEWKNASARNMQYFQSMEIIFLNSASEYRKKEFNTDAAWEKMKREMHSKQSGTKVRNLDLNSTRYAFLKIAAMLLIMAGLGFGAYKLLHEEVVPVTLASNDEVEEFGLPDSTTIVLNRNTTLVYTFTKEKRQVELHGEALFEPTEDPGRPFEVIAAGVTIRDIGTTFNVRAHDGNDSMTVQVMEGEVILTSVSNQSLVLKRGEEALYLKSRDEFIRMAIADTNVTAYRTKIFVFENASLDAVVQKLNEVYDIEITVSDAIRSCHLTATFKNENPDAIVEIIAETLQLTITRKDKKIMLDGTVCEE